MTTKRMTFAEWTKFHPGGEAYGTIEKFPHYWEVSYFQFSPSRRSGGGCFPTEERLFAWLKEIGVENIKFVRKDFYKKLHKNMMNAE